ncbi:hypothetical protein N657DRAFT_135329 [Parathielavia appendiculata]|uniref:Uncharacterized protein n=1 Tax=Parathielavia appendiculata TaxID=2587402 RepID=A0AAN6Z0N3_9PEZI|nr:hypothetical protein N657DRAFT_135329 [Parathielavia appendiculata]
MRTRLNPVVYFRARRESRSRAVRTAGFHHHPRMRDGHLQRVYRHLVRVGRSVPYGLHQAQWRVFRPDNLPQRCSQRGPPREGRLPRVGGCHLHQPARHPSQSATSRSAGWGPSTHSPTTR